MGPMTKPRSLMDALALGFIRAGLATALMAGPLMLANYSGPVAPEHTIPLTVVTP
jgi:hypothetical protein